MQLVIFTTNSPPAARSINIVQSVVPDNVTPLKYRKQSFIIKKSETELRINDHNII